MSGTGMRGRGAGIASIKWVAHICVASFVPFLAAGGSASVGGLDSLRVDSVDVEQRPASAFVSISVRNVGKEPITAFAVRVVAVNADLESNEFRWTEDFVLGASSDSPSTDALTSLPAGALWTKTRPIRTRGATGGLVKVEASVAMVAFQDGSIVGDGADIELLTNSRTSTREGMLALLSSASAVSNTDTSARESRIASIVGPRNSRDPYYTRRAVVLRRFATRLATQAGIGTADLSADWKARFDALSVPMKSVTADLQ